MNEKQDFQQLKLMFVVDRMHQLPAAQSLAALMAVMVKRGAQVSVTTVRPPSSDDYISDHAVKRYALGEIQYAGVPRRQLFASFLRESGAEIVVLASPFGKSMRQCFHAAKDRGKTVLLLLERSPLFELADGRQGAHQGNHSLLRDADAVVCLTAQDADLAVSLGSKNSCQLPFYYPYGAHEVEPNTLKGRRVVYYASGTERDFSAAVTAFFHVRERCPDAQLQLVLKEPPQEPLPQTDVLQVEVKPLKPLWALRDADVCMVYGDLAHMPPMAMESIASGIPTLLLQNADYSGCDMDAVCLHAADTAQIAQRLTEYMDFDKRMVYQKAAREKLSERFRADLAARWMVLLRATQEQCVLRQNEAGERVAALKQAFSAVAGDETAFAALLRTKLCEGETAAQLFFAALQSGVQAQRLLALFTDCPLLEAEARTAMRGMRESIAQLPRVFSEQDWSDSRTLVLLLLSGMDLARVHTDLAAQGIHGGSLPTLLERGFAVFAQSGGKAVFGENAALTTQREAVNSFMEKNEATLQYKNRFFVRSVVRFVDWYASDRPDKGIVSKMVAGGFGLLSKIKKAVTAHGVRRLAKNKTVEVDPADIRKIQLLVLKMALEMDRICKKHGLQYFLAGGTLLGAVRHEGFIPWDDDMDVTMPRADYDRFMRIAQKELGAEYQLDMDCVPFCHNRIELRGTSFHTTWREGKVFLDILALEGSPNDPALMRRHERKCRFWRRCMLEKSKPLPALNFKRTVMRRYLIRGILKFVPRRFLKWRWNHWAKKYGTAKTENWVCLPASIYSYEQERFPVSDWGQPLMVTFEGRQFPTMQGWEKYLICHFGKYMKLPPETVRKSHHYVYGYSLGKYADMTEQELEAELLREFPL